MCEENCMAKRIFTEENKGMNPKTKIDETDLSNLEASICELLKHLQMDPSDTSSWLKLAALFLEEKEWAKAEAALEEARTHGAKLDDILLRLAYAMIHQRDIVHAQSVIQKVTEVRIERLLEGANWRPRVSP